MTRQIAEYSTRIAACMSEFAPGEWWKTEKIQGTLNTAYNEQHNWVYTLGALRVMEEAIKLEVRHNTDPQYAPVGPNLQIAPVGSHLPITEYRYPTHPDAPEVLEVGVQVIRHMQRELYAHSAPGIE